MLDVVEVTGRVGVNIHWLAEYCGTSIGENEAIKGNTLRAMRRNGLRKSSGAVDGSNPSDKHHSQAVKRC